MKLLVVTQRVDAKDTNLGIHVSWLREFASRAEQVTVIAQSVGTYDLPANVRVLSLGKEKGSSKLLQLIRLKLFLLREMPKHDAVLVLMVPLYAVMAGIYSMFYRKPIYLWYTHKHVPFLLRVANVFVRRIFTASAESMRLKSDKVRVMGHAIDMDRFNIDPNGRNDTGSIISVGRVSKTKGIDMIVESTLKLIEEGAAAHLEIYGLPITDDDRSFQTELESTLKTLGISDRQVRFRGGSDYESMVSVYQGAQVFVNASSTGSLDKAVLEAMACGCPVVTSNEAFKDIVPSGCFVAATEGVNGLVRAIRPQLEDPVSAIELRDRVVGKHDLHRTLGALMDQIAADIG